MALQHTIKKSGTLTGVGLHTAAKATVTLNPAPENYGIRFIRTDLENQPEIIADIDNVVDNSRGTAIGKNGVVVYTIEHVMAALAGLQIDNCRIEVDAQEIPLMDGSAAPFVELIKQLGIKQQEAQREFITIDKPMLLYNKGDIALGVFPADHFHITLMIEYKHPAIGAQHTTLFNLDDFAKDFAPARTFCFLSEIEKLLEQGLIKGGTINSAVVIQDVDITEEHAKYLSSLFGRSEPIRSGKNGFLNDTQLHFPNELCRHKAVDLIGDLYLLGKPICGHVLGARTGHAANIELARKIREYVTERDKTQKATVKELSYDEILNILPHRYPFLLVDKVLAVEPRKKITAIKKVSFNEPFFEGHYPGNPIMPGVLQIEAMAQAGCIMILYGDAGSKDIVPLFIGVDKCRFRGQVRPGDDLRIEIEMLHDRRTTVRFNGKCFVNNNLICEAEILAMLGKKEKSQE